MRLVDRIPKKILVVAAAHEMTFQDCTEENSVGKFSCIRLNFFEDRSVGIFGGTLMEWNDFGAFDHGLKEHLEEFSALYAPEDVEAARAEFSAMIEAMTQWFTGTGYLKASISLKEKKL